MYGGRCRGYKTTTSHHLASIKYLPTVCSTAISQIPFPLKKCSKFSLKNKWSHSGWLFSQKKNFLLNLPLPIRVTAKLIFLLKHR